MTEDERSAWKAVWDQLKQGNPTFFEVRQTGLECVLAEIRRLQDFEARIRCEVEGR